MKSIPSMLCVSGRYLCMVSRRVFLSAQIRLVAGLLSFFMAGFFISFLYQQYFLPKIILTRESPVDIII